ncbi:C4-type zinc ribbon domain-containing protein [Candidatus Magnetomoraceae bacterium gMMP-1]
MKDQLSVLIQLQEADTKISQQELMLNQWPEKINGLEAKLKSFVEKIEADENHKKEIEKKQREYESIIDDNIARIKKSDERLTSVKSNKEYQAMLKEIEKIKKKNSQMEDEVIQSLEQVEEITKQIKIRKKDLVQMQSEVDLEKKKLDSEHTEIKKNFDKLKIKRNEFTSHVKPYLMQRYEMIKKAGGGIAVSHVQNAVCAGCNLNIPPQMYNELQKNSDLVYCPHCHRIIYWKKE